MLLLIIKHIGVTHMDEHKSSVDEYEQEPDPSEDSNREHNGVDEVSSINETDEESGDSDDIAANMTDVPDTQQPQGEPNKADVQTTDSVEKKNGLSKMNALSRAIINIAFNVSSAGFGALLGLFLTVREVETDLALEPTFTVIMGAFGLGIILSGAAQYKILSDT